jgi:hypothetical protein
VTNQTNTPATDSSSAADAASPPGEAATLRIVRGEPTPEELAALVAVLAARSAAGGAEPEAPRVVSTWADRSRYVRSGRLGFGAGSGWRAAALPR